MSTLNDRIEDLEKQVKQLQTSLASISTDTENKHVSPDSTVGGIRDRSTIRPIDARSGLNQNLGGGVIWNSPEINVKPSSGEPTNPDTLPSAKGYNKHAHSRFSGGALIKDVLEIVEYVWGSITNKHSQAYWQEQPTIAKTNNTKGESVDKIGKLDLMFNPNGGYDVNGNPIGSWGVAAYEINVQKCYLVMRGTDGNIMLDSNGNEMKSPLYNDDVTKTAVVWDAAAKVWRFYAAYAPGA